MTTVGSHRWTDSSIRRPNPSAAFWYLLAGFVAIAGYYLLPTFAPEIVQGVLYDVISAAAAVAIVAAVRLRRPARPLPWLLLAVAQLAYVIGDVVYTYENQVVHTDAYPTLA